MRCRSVGAPRFNSMARVTLTVGCLLVSSCGANSGSREWARPVAVTVPRLSPAEATELASLGRPDYEHTLSEATRLLKPGEWRVDADFDVYNGGSVSRGNVSLVTLNPERTLGLLLRRSVSRDEVLSGGFVRPDFIVRVPAGSASHAYLDAFRDGDARLSARLVGELAYGGVKLVASLGDEGRMLDPAGKKNPKSRSAGTLLYRADPRATGYGASSVMLPPARRSVELMHCPGRVASYSGAYLVTRSLFLKVDYSIKAHLEAASMNTFGAADYAMKAADFRDFFVNHFSEWEHWYKRQKASSSGHLRELSSMMDRECGAMLREHGGVTAESLASGDDDGRSPGLVLVPFWGGTAEQSGGNSHSEASREAKHMQAAGTVCSGLRYFRRAVVGTCRAEDSASIKEWLEKAGFASLVTLASPSVRLDYGDRLNNASAVSEAMAHFTSHPMRLVAPGRGASMVRPRVPGEDDAAPPAPLPPPNGVTVLEFACTKGVHLPYHLLATTQALLRRDGAWGHWAAPAAFAAREASKAAVRAEAARPASKAAVRAEAGGAAVGAEVREEAAKAEAEARAVSDLWRGSDDGVDFIFFSEADQLVSFRDKTTARAIATSLVHPPSRPSMAPAEGLAPFPVSHKDKVGVGLRVCARACVVSIDGAGV